MEDWVHGRASRNPDSLYRALPGEGLRRGWLYCEALTGMTTTQEAAQAGTGLWGRK
jgi:hypothetical protein